jgi:hypothetical protein
MMTKCISVRILDVIPKKVAEKDIVADENETLCPTRPFGRSVFKIIIQQGYDVTEYYSMCTFPNLFIYLTDYSLYCLYINPVV